MPALIPDFVDLEIAHIRRVMPLALLEPNCVVLLGASYWGARIANLLQLKGLSVRQKCDLQFLRDQIVTARNPPGGP